MALIEYHNEGSFEEEDLSLSLLEISLKHGIPHMHVCGGTARCSTCRVAILENHENVLPRNGLEQRLGGKKGLEDNIRLACQTRVKGPVKIRRLALDDQDCDMVVGASQQTTGRETRLAILFSDIRDFTVFSEGHLPYDTIHILNRYFYQMGDCILQNDGYIDKYMGDGIMALFGVNSTDSVRNCYNAVTAGLQMIDELNKLNKYLKKTFDVEFKTGIGIHFGDAVLGELGHPDRRQITVIGDSVNMASRIESSTKSFGIPLLISESVRRELKDQIETGHVVDAQLKGKSGSYKLYEVLKLFAEPQSGMSENENLRKLKRAIHSAISLQKAPLMLRLAFHDAGSWNSKTKTGGADGSIRFPEELARDENKGLQVAIDLLKPIKEQFPDVSWADLIALGGALSVARVGGPEIFIPMGRKDADKPCPTGLIPNRETSEADVKGRFADMGFTLKEMVALTGAHTIGRNEGKPFTDSWFTFSNAYFKLLMQDEEKKRHLLKVDHYMMRCPECRKYVEQYAEDQDLFFMDFAMAYRKMSLLGTGIPDPGLPSYSGSFRAPNV